MAQAFVDTSALLALANPRDQYHGRAVDIARQHLSTGGRWLGTTLVLAELHGLLLYRRGPTLAGQVLEELLEDPAFEWVGASSDLVHDALANWLMKYRDQSFTLTDGVSFAVMQRESMRAAFAFDHDFVTAGFELLS